MLGRPASQHCEEVEGDYYWYWALVLPVTVSVSGIFHSDIVAVFVVE